MRFLRRIAIVVVASVTLACAANYLLLDGLVGAFVAWVYRDRDMTVFAPGYTAWGFFRVRSDMTEEEVLAFLGEPLKRTAQEPDERRWGDVRWQYSDGRLVNSSHYVRVIFFRGGRVVKKFSSYDD